MTSIYGLDKDILKIYLYTKNEVRISGHSEVKTPNIQTARQTSRHPERQTDRQKDRQKNRQKDRQTDKPRMRDKESN